MDDMAEFVAEPLAATPSIRDRVLLFDNEFNLCPRPDGGIWWWREDVADRIPPSSLLPVGRLGDERILTAHYDGGQGSLLSLRSVFPESSSGERAALGAARQRLQWLKDHRYCGRCGHETAWHETEYTRYCEHCRHRQYPRLSPCVIVAIRDGGCILLGRSHRHPPDLWSLIAGFVEPGESAEQAVAREVMEETGLLISNLRYQESESWPFPHQLMLGYIADYAGGELARASDELAGLDWFHRDALPRVPGSWTIAGRLIGMLSKSSGDE